MCAPQKALQCEKMVWRMASMRRMPRAQALRAFVYHRPQVLALGLVFAVAGLVPVLNLFVPVLGTAAMVHVLHRNDWQ